MSDISYPEPFIRMLELVWGKGFLSPGGPDEVREILKGTETRGMSILDIGCGVAGPAIVIGHEMDPGEVIGIDVEPQLIEIGGRNIEDEGLGGKVSLQLVEPGPLPFDDGRFDIVFSKDALIHIGDKAGLYRDIQRVLKPGGVFAASDWLASANAGTMPGYRRYRELSHLKFAMQTPEQAAKLLQRAGFAEVRTHDRNAWYAEVAKANADAIAGPLREHYLEFCSEETWRHALEKTRANAAAATEGSLRPTLLCATKP